MSAETTPAPVDQRHAAGLEVRSFEVREVDTAARTVTGIAVPWDDEVRISGWLDDYFESIARGACEADPGEPKLFWLHRAAIGKVIETRDTDAGWEITARISQTPTGDEAYTLLRDGVIDRMSIGFEPIEHVETKDDDGRLHVTRTRVRVREVSLVPFPAYDGAKVAAVRHRHPTDPAPTPPDTKEHPVTETATREDVRVLSEHMDELQRSVALLQAHGPSAPADRVDQYRSIGEFLRAIVAGDETAQRAYEGAVSGDTVLKDAWVGDLTEIIRKRRPMLETFARGVLPAQGMGVEFAVLKSDTTQVGVQANEGDDLLFGKVSIETKTAPVDTLGGWSAMSRQAIERASVSVLDTLFEALHERYGQASEAYVRARFNAAVTATGAGKLAEVTADLTTQDGIVALVLDLVEHFENVGRSLDGLWLDKASFRALYAVEASERVLQIGGQPADKVGTLSVRTASGSVAGLPFKLLPNATAGTVVAYDQTAIKTLESPGAPTRLQDDNVVNLTRDFSVYGYVSAAVQKPAGLVKVKPAAAGA